jgi:hypothetical protein
VYDEHGMAQRNGTGMFPREIMSRFPLLPLEEGRLNDMPLRENSVERVFGLRRKAALSAWQFARGKMHDRMDSIAGRGTHAGWPGQVPYRPQADADDPRALNTPVPWHYTEMGRLVTDAGKRDWDELGAEYGAMLMEGLAVMGCKRSGRGQACQRPSAPDGIPED